MVESVDSLIVKASGEISDRTNLVIAANAFLFGAFATMLGSTSLNGYKLYIPIIICILGIAINIYLEVLSFKQANKIKKILQKRPNAVVSEIVKEYYTSNNIENGKVVKGEIFDAILSTFNKGAPIILTIGWILCLVLYTLQTTVGIV